MHFRKNSCIKVIYKVNGGTVSARKTGIEFATGTYAACVDSDDWIESEMLEFMLKRMGSADIVVCGVERDFGTNVSYEINKMAVGVYKGDKLKELFSKMIYTGKFFERGILPYVVGKLFRIDILRRNQLSVPNEINVAEDLACAYPAMLDAREVVIISECFYHYQMRDDSVMGINYGNEMAGCKIFYFYMKKDFQ